MGYLDYYQYQTKARGIRNLQDVQRGARDKAYIYDRVVLPWLPVDQSRCIAELACGHGSFLCWLKERGFNHVVGIDSSAEQIQMARQVGVKVEQDDINRWLTLQPDESQQVIIGIDLIEHISKDEFMDLLQSSQRVLAPGGRLILRYPNGDSPIVGLNLYNDITHVWTYTTNCLRTLAGMHRFEHVHYVDECTAIRDHRWLKIPLSKLSTLILRLLFQAATREKVRYWSPHIWACLEKQGQTPQYRDQ